MIRRVLARYGLLIPAALTALAVWAAFHQWDSTRDQDRALLYAIAAGCAATVLMQLRFNEAWGSIDVGIGVFFCATGLLIFRLAQGNGISEAEGDRIRALFATALLILFVGYGAWIIRRRQRRRAEPAEDRLLYEGPDRRGALPGRRSGDRR